MPNLFLPNLPGPKLSVPKLSVPNLPVPNLPVPKLPVPKLVVAGEIDVVTPPRFRPRRRRELQSGRMWGVPCDAVASGPK